MANREGAGSWKQSITKEITGHLRTRFFTTDLFYKLVDAHMPGASKNTRERILNWFVETGSLRRVCRGLYLNECTQPTPQLAELAQYFVPDAVVSLHTVLGDNGVLNNLTVNVTSVVPVDKWPHWERTSKRETSLGFMNYRYMPRDKVYPPDLDSTEYLFSTKSFPMARPEKALCDYLYLSRNNRSSLPLPPMDTDLDNLDKKLLWKIARSMGVDDELDSYLESKRDYDEDPNVQANMNINLGF